MHAEIAIIHLVRAGTGASVLAEFVDSYLRHSAGHDHNLVFLLKGFPRNLPGDVSAILDRSPHSRIVCPDNGFDIGSYYYAAERVTERVVMFLNSFSTIQGDSWLLKLVQASSEPGVGLVGASGSWESMVSTLLDAPQAGGHEYSGRRFSRLKAQILGLPLRIFFPAFPNPHVRSNAFMLLRDDFLSMRPPRMRCKLQAWLFESGRSSMTRQILRRGLRVMVVGRNGMAYRIANWSKSGTFWQAQQENLLIHDNRSLAYSCADATVQARLCRMAWICRSD
jgi:hypothetical protein